MTGPLLDVCAASLPGEGLAVLARLRTMPEVEVVLADGRAWVQWPAGNEDVLRCVLPIAGVRLYIQRDGQWFPFGAHLPAFEVPPTDAPRPLDRVLLPAPVQAVPPPLWSQRPVPLRLTVDPRPRRTTATVCDVADLATWAETTPSARLTALLAARHGRHMLLLGKRLPLLPGAERFWGERVFVPLGWRPEPELPDSAVCMALGIEEDAVLLAAGRSGFQPDSSRQAESLTYEPDVDIVPRAALQPLSRARLRLALREADG